MKRFLNLIVLTATMVFASTSYGQQSDFWKPKSGDVYVVGYIQSGEVERATVWKNGIVQNLSYNGKFGAIAYSVFVSGEDVYVAGYEKTDEYFGGNAKLWKNGVAQNLAGGTNFYATSVFVLGSNVYVVGNEFTEGDGSSTAVIKVWKNGIAQYLTKKVGGQVHGNSIYVSGNNVYVAGTDRDDNAEYVTGLWKNGIAQNFIGDVYGSAYSVYASGIDVYVAGHVNYRATVWKNGVAQNLTDGARDACANSVFVSGSNIYVAGYENDAQDKSIAKVWKNGKVQNLTYNGNFGAVANSIFVSGEDVYVAGYEKTSEYLGGNAKVWKNGVAQNLTNGTRANSIFVVDNEDIGIQHEKAAQKEREAREAREQKIRAFGGTIVPGNSLADKFTWLQRSAESHNTYIIEVMANQSIAPHTFEYKGAINITIVLIGDDENRTIRLSSNGTMFTVRPNVTLILDDNITLQGHSQNTGSMVNIDGGIFKMNDGATITGNDGGGVYMNRGSFEMIGGTISGNGMNKNFYGGGVDMRGGSFTMHGGTISGNKASDGGGVYVKEGTFTMKNGNIFGNIATNGGGVYANMHAEFNMRDGIIKNNTAHAFGGGVYLEQWVIVAKFNKTGGIITGYNSDSNDGNVVKDESGVFARKGHAIYINENTRKEITVGTRVNLSSNSNENWNDNESKAYTTGEQKYSSNSENSTYTNVESDRGGAPATLYVYRMRGNALINLGTAAPYDIFLGNTVIGRSKNKWKTIVTVNDFGKKAVSATIEGRSASINIDFEPGGVYYIRGGYTSRTYGTGKYTTYTNSKTGKTESREITRTDHTPTLQLVDKSIGKNEYDSIKEK